MKIEPQIERLYQELDRALDDFPVGTKFYSVRQILDKFNCHRGVLDGVLDRMAENNLITRVPQVGIFSNVNRKAHARRILFAAPDWPSALILEWGRCATTYVEKHENWQLSKVIYDPERSTIASLNLAQYDGAIIIHDARLLSKEELAWLSEVTIPIVLLNANTSCMEISCVTSTDDLAAADACRYLVKHGHRKLALMQSEPPHPTVACRIRSFLRTAELLEVEAHVIDCHTASVEYARHRAYQGLKEYLSDHNGEADFTAMYVVSGESVAGVMTALREFNYQIPDDISIMGHASEQEGEFLHPPLTAVCTDLNAEVEAAFSGLENCFNGQTRYFHAAVPTKIIERESVRQFHSKV